ncbi:hypothetical protein DFJ74DRAFT_92200 [Hyaloraphidium curvatum]|nr:hypothetical protein DFJ74DRAFT_92200 [Hyaloraphidium curvatum]
MAEAPSLSALAPTEAPVIVDRASRLASVGISEPRYTDAPASLAEALEPAAGQLGHHSIPHALEDVVFAPGFVPICRQTPEAREAWIAEHWTPFLAKLDAELAEVKRRSAAGYRPEERMPSQDDMRAFTAACYRLTAVWYGVPNVCCVYQFLIACSETAGIETVYRVEDIPQRRSDDGFILGLDGKSRAGAYAIADRLYADLLQRGTMEQRAGANDIDTTLLPNVVTATKAKVLLGSQVARNFVVKSIKSLQRTMLRRLGAVLGMPTDDGAASSILSLGPEELRAVLAAVTDEELHRAQIRRDNVVFAALIRRGAPLENWGQMDAGLQKRIQQYVELEILANAEEEEVAARTSSGTSWGTPAPASPEASPQDAASPDSADAAHGDNVAAPTAHPPAHQLQKLITGWDRHFPESDVVEDAVQATSPTSYGGPGPADGSPSAATGSSSHLQLPTISFSSEDGRNTIGWPVPKTEPESLPGEPGTTEESFSSDHRPADGRVSPSTPSTLLPRATSTHARFSPTLGPLFSEFVAWVHEFPGRYFHDDEEEHRRLLILGMWTDQLAVLRRKLVEKLTLYRYISLHWWRAHDSFVALDGGGTRVIRPKGSREHSRFRKNAFPYARLHGMGLLSGGIDSSLFHGQTHRQSRMLYELGAYLDPGAKAPNWWNTDIEKIVVEAMHGSPTETLDRLLPRDAYLNVGQNPKIGSSIGATLHTHVTAGSVLSFPVYCLINRPAFCPAVDAEVDLVQVGSSEDAFFVKLHVAAESDPVTCGAVGFLISLRRKLVAVGGREVDFVCRALPSPVRGGLYMILIVLGDLREDKALGACVNNQTGENTLSPEFPVTNFDLSISGGGILGKLRGRRAVPKIFLTFPAPVKAAERWEAALEGRPALDRLYDFMRFPGARKIVAEACREVGYTDPANGRSESADPGAEVAETLAKLSKLGWEAASDAGTAANGTAPGASESK